MKNQKGFTLIELLLVLAIIGIISAIAIPALLGQRERAKAKAVQGNMDAVAGELARVNDTLKANATGVVTPDTVVASVLALSNYNTPDTMNPYQGKTAPYASTDTKTTGQVCLVANSAYVDPATSQSYGAVTIIGYYLNGSTLVSTAKLVALD
jgi:prepilin-type N-terminal cleavage/methylation domain-containing protein